MGPDEYENPDDTVDPFNPAGIGTVTTTVDPGGRKISVTYEHKRGLDNYGSETCRAWVEGTIPADASADVAAAELLNLFTAAVVAVSDQLNLPVTVSDDGVIRADVTVATTTSKVDSGGQTAPKPALGGQNLRIMNPADSENNGPLPDWLFDKTAAAGITAVWDNRHTAQGTRKPHFTEAIPKGGTGKGKEGSAMGFWP